VLLLLASSSDLHVKLLYERYLLKIIKNNNDDTGPPKLRQMTPEKPGDTWYIREWTRPDTRFFEIQCTSSNDDDDGPNPFALRSVA